MSYVFRPQMNRAVHTDSADLKTITTEGIFAADFVTEDLTTDRDKASSNNRRVRYRNISNPTIGTTARQEFIEADRSEIANIYTRRKVEPERRAATPNGVKLYISDSQLHTFRDNQSPAASGGTIPDIDVPFGGSLMFYVATGVPYSVDNIRDEIKRFCSLAIAMVDDTDWLYNALKGKIDL